MIVFNAVLRVFKVFYNYLEQPCFEGLEEAFEHARSRALLSNQYNRLRCYFKLPKSATVPLREKLQLDVARVGLASQTYKKLKIEMIRGAFYTEGHFFARHQDNIHYENFELIKHRVLSAVFVVKTADKGGELIFENLGEEHFPANSLVVFSSNIEHEVTPIIKGERQTVFVFWSKDSLINRKVVKQRIKEHVRHSRL